LYSLLPCIAIYTYLPYTTLFRSELGRFMTRTRRMLPAVTAPVLVLRSQHDHVVSDASHLHVLRRAGGDVELVRLAESFHVATLRSEERRGGEGWRAWGVAEACDK